MDSCGGSTKSGFRHHPEQLEKVRPERVECRIGQAARARRRDRGVGHDAALIQHQDPVGQQDGLDDVVRDQQNARPVTSPQAQIPGTLVRPVSDVRMPWRL